MAHIADGPKIAVGDSAKLHESHLAAAKFDASVISLSFVEVVEDHFKRAYGVESVESRGMACWHSRVAVRATACLVPSGTACLVPSGTACLVPPA
jgi:hypothetical protein